MIVLVGAFVGVAIFFSQTRTYIEKRKKIKEELQKETFDSIVQSKFILAFYLVFIAFAIFSVGYGVMLAEDSTISIGLLLFFMSLGEVLNFNHKFKLYYNAGKFICNGTVIRYRSVKSIKKKKGISLGMHELETLTGQREIISKEGIEVLKQYVKIEVK